MILLKEERMSKRQDLWSGLGVLFLLGGLLLGPMTAQAVLKAGMQAPDFTMQLLSGESFTLGKLKGKPVVLNFFASW